MSADGQTGGRELAVLGIAGSIRSGSLNRALLAAAASLAPAGMVVEVWDGLREVPPYDAEVESAPGSVADLRDRITAADALLIVTPEYNYSIPGVLKNAIDWASRPARRSPLHGKPVALMGASPGMSGTIRAQIALREVLFSTGSRVLPEPEVYVAQAKSKFDGEPVLTDQATREHVRGVMLALDGWVRRHIADR